MTTLKSIVVLIVAALMSSVALYAAEAVITADTEEVTATKIIEAGNLPHQVIETSYGDQYRVNIYTERTREVGEAVHWDNHDCGWDLSCIRGMLVMLAALVALMLSAAMAVCACATLLRM